MVNHLTHLVAFTPTKDFAKKKKIARVNQALLLHNLCSFISIAFTLTAPEKGSTFSQ